MQEKEHEFSFKSLFVPLTTLKTIHIIVIVGFIVFGNALFNGFVGDDKGQYVANTMTHSLSNIPFIFHSVLQVHGNNTIDFFYRPLTFTIITFLNFLFGLSPFYFHLVQLVLHITNSILVYFLFKKYIKIIVAFFIALIFLLHPANSETVSYISNLQDILFMFFGLIALQVLTSTLPSIKKVLLLSAALLASLLSKETGVLFCIVVPLYTFLLLQKQRLQVLFATSFSFITYLFLRFSSDQVESFYVNPSAMSLLSLSERLMSVPKIIFHYLQLFIFPKDLALGWSWTVEKLEFGDFYFPLLIDLLFFISLVIFLYYLHLKKSKLQKAYIFFIVWFLLGLAAHIQLVPLDFTVADRWMYFPLIGLLGIAGIGISSLYNDGRKTKNIAILILCLLLIGFGIRTVVRNLNFYDDLTLTSHDVKVIPNSYLLENTIGVTYLFNGNLNAAKEHLERSIYLDQHSQSWNNLGIMYAKLGDLKKARQYLHKSVELSDYGNYELAYENLAKVELLSNNPKEAKRTAEMGLVKFPNEPNLWLALATAEYQLGDKEAVLIYVQKAKTLDKSININDFIIKLSQ